MAYRRCNTNLIQLRSFLADNISTHYRVSPTNPDGTVSCRGDKGKRSSGVTTETKVVSPYLCFAGAPAFTLAVQVGSAY